MEPSRYEPPTEPPERGRWCYACGPGVWHPDGESCAEDDPDRTVERQRAAIRSINAMMGRMMGGRG